MKHFYQEGAGGSKKPSPEKLTVMLNLRRNGWGLDLLGLFLGGIHHTSIADQCDKYGIKPLVHPHGAKRLVKPLKLYLRESNQDYGKWRIIDGERVNRGKNYADYVQVRTHTHIE